MPDPIRLTVGSRDAGTRLDAFLAEHLSEASRSAVQRWIEAGLVAVTGRAEKARYRVREGDQVRVTPPPPQPTELIPEDIPLRVVYEDEALIVVDKPAGLVVHPGAGNPSGTLANALVRHFGSVSRQEGLRPGIVHRLDKDTSGLIVVAKSDSVHDSLARQFKNREVTKGYLALVHGVIDRDKGVIDAPLGRHPRSRVKISTRSRKLRESLTEFEVLRRWRRFTFLAARPKTGRTHQIRVHFQSIGHPVVGDALYGAAAREANLQADLRIAIQRLGRQFLHAASLSFRHPVTGRRATFDSPLPAELAELLARLE